MCVGSRIFLIGVNAKICISGRMVVEVVEGRVEGVARGRLGRSCDGC